MMNFLSIFLSLLVAENACASPLTQLLDLSSTVVNKTRQSLNLSNTFGSQTSVPAYERLGSQPVFTVTTPWGSPYLLFERTDRTESSLEFDEDESSSRKKDNNKQVALYFMDEEDAMRLRDEMLQMDQMSGADMRITSSSLSKALSQTVNLHKGLMSGQPIDDHSGKMKGPEEGGVLRYKIVPPKRELFYASRCEGRERVGLFGATAEDDARLMMQNVPVIGGNMAVARKKAFERRKRQRRAAATGAAPQGTTEPTTIREEYEHMEGFVGIPVFHCPEMKKYNALKGILRNDRKKQSPLYFSYEDCVSSYESMRAKSKNPSSIPEKPKVEVYNLMDVVTSVDRDQWKVTRAMQLRRAGILGKIPVINKITGNTSENREVNKVVSGLGQIIFVPNSKNTKFKENISLAGNNKARGMRPMRPWGRDAM
mmetsp:Transcript_29589/g.45172  ORF Transcript_29589/g.45172 Transcript_29589/m.45172 type:complete len:426 (-) Transcript_29589:61-1338(-)